MLIVKVGHYCIMEYVRKYICGRRNNLVYF